MSLLSRFVKDPAGTVTNIPKDVGNFVKSGGLLNPQNIKNYTAIGGIADRAGLFENQQAGAGGGYAEPGITQPAYQSQLDSPTYKSMQGQFASGSSSPWANIAIARQGELAEKNKQELMQRGAGQTATSLDKLAAQGGLTSGARERTIQAGQENMMGGVQDVGSAYKSNVMNIGIDDAQAKQQIGKGLMTAEMGDLQGRNQYNQNKYQTDMAAWGAKQLADATRASGGGGGGPCFITTAVCDHLGLPDDSDFLNTFRKFRDEFMGGKNSEELQKYYTEAPAIVEKVNDSPRKSVIWQYAVDNYLVPAYFAIVRKDNEDAHGLYKKMFNFLRDI